MQGIIPFLGFRVENIDQDGIPCEEHTGWKAKVLQAEWLGFGFFIFVGKVYWCEKDDSK